MARTLLEQNKLRGALNHLEDAIEELRTGDCPDSALALARWREVAVLAGRAHGLEDEAEARQRVLELLSQSRSAEDPEVLEAKVDLACARSALGDHGQARALLGEVIAAAVGTLPESAELLLRARHALASTLFALDELLAACIEIEAVLEHRVKRLPPHDPLLLQTKLDAAQIRRVNGDLEGARLLLVEVLSQDRALLAQGETTTARVELAATSIEIESPERVRSLLEELSSEQELRRSSSNDQLLRRLAAFGARLEDLEMLEPAVYPSSADASAHIEGSPRPELRRSQLMNAFLRLRPGEPARDGSTSGLDLGPQAIPSSLSPGRAAGISGLPIPRASGLSDVAQDAGRDVPGLLRAAPLWSQGLEGTSLDGKIAVSIAAAQSARSLYAAVTERRKQVQYLEEDLPRDDPRLFDARLELALEAWGFDGTRVSLESLDEILEQSGSSRPPEDPALVEAKWQLALTKRELGDLEGAQPLLTEVLSAREALLDRLHPDLHETLAALTWNELELGRTFDARVHTARVLERMRERVRDSWCLAPREARETAHVELRRLADAFSLVDALDSPEVFEREVFELLESLRLLSMSLPPALASGPGTAAMRSEVGRLRAELADLCQVIPAAPREARLWSQQVRDLQRRLDELGREVLVADTALAELMRRVRTEDLEKVLAPRAAFIGFWRNVRTFPRPRGKMEPISPQARYTAFLVRPGVFERVDLGSSQAIEDLVRAYRGELPLAPADGRGVSVEEASSTGLCGSAEGLRATLIEPLRPWLDDVQELHLCLDDALHLIPLEAMPFDEKTLLGERFEVLRELSLDRLLAPEPARVEGPSVLTLCGGIDYDAEPVERAAELVTAPLGGRSAGSSKLAPLPGTAREVESLAALYSASRAGEMRLLTGSAASKPALRESVAGARYVHLATHGWFAGDGLPSRGDDGPIGAQALLRGFAPMVLCGLALAGANRGADERGRVPGILTAEELASFDLGKCELAVLSACETSVGIRRAGQGIQSLQTALHAAGARTAITSLWKVDDAATRRFFELFYTKLWKDDLGRADALWQAKMALRAEGRPLRDWAGWVLSGDPY